jgi:threonine dehydratase
LKIETIQPTFSFKIRGAFNAVLRLIETHGRGTRLVTASAGNHGRALAWAAAEAGLPLIVYVPKHAPRTKIDAIRASGADVTPCDDYDQAERLAKEHGARGDALFISPYSHPDVIAGAGTVGLEILEDWPDVDCVVVPIGGGGLVSGVALACRGLSDAASVVGVEVEASSPFTQSLAAGRIVDISVRPTLADGLAGNMDPDTITFDVVRRLVTKIVLVSESDLMLAVAGVVKEERLVVEGAGATGVAAVLRGRIDLRDRRVAIVVSGGNIDSDTLKAIV